MKIAIVGGVAGGATTAARLRRNDENAQIIMFERGEYISYANCGLPYYLGDVIKERENLFVQTPEDFNARFNVDVRVNNAVLSIDREKKILKVVNVKTGDHYDESYDKLVLSPGADPIIPPLPGIKNKGIFTLRNVKDTDTIKNFVDTNKPKKVVVIGAGFIGLEMAENFHHKGMNVSIVEMANQVMGPLDYTMATAVHQHLKTKNVEFYLKDSVISFSEVDGRILVNLRSGRQLKSDMVILSIGVRPEKKLAEDAGLKIGERGGICVNKYLQTDDENIYAVGDAIEFPHPLTGKYGTMFLAGPANKQGRICANNLAFGNSSEYKGAIGTAIAKVFDITVGAVGIPAKQLKQQNIPFLKAITHNADHAGYYPGAIPMTIQIQFSPTDGKLFGAQVVGYQGADKRLDVLASIMKNGGTIYDLMEFEQAYAPPYNSAKDPINIIGFIAENILLEKMKPIFWNEVADFPEAQLVDVRTADEFMLGSIKNAINIPVDEIRTRISELSKDKKIILFCGVGLRGYVASRTLMQSGFDDVYNLMGGLKTYEFATDKQSNEDIFEGDVVGKDDMLYPTEVVEKAPVLDVNTLEVDACGLQCPGPIMRLKKSMDKATPGQRLLISATDQGFQKDVRAWCNSTGNILHSVKIEGGTITADLEKGEAPTLQPTATSMSKNKTMIMFSDDLDKALATMILANGAAASGGEVTLFFTFWGLNVIKRTNKPKVEKAFMDKMFSKMMPKHSDQLQLSKMNMGGLGAKMIKGRMKAHNVDSLEKLMNSALDNGVKFIACQMSMDIMGVKLEELVEGVEVGGVASYMSQAEQASVNLFI